MKNFVKNAKTFLLFEQPLQPAFIRNEFKQVHTTSNNVHPGWSTKATRQQLIYRYWYRYAASHFITVLIIAALLVFPFNDTVERSALLLGFLSAGIMAYGILYLFHYRPWYSATFLPQLETIKETYEHKQQEHLDKCRKAQLSNFALTLVFYALDKTANLNSLQCNDRTANTLAKLYGVDPGSLKKNLTLIFGKSHQLTGRKSTEIRNHFGEGFSFLEEINCPEGIKVLKQLEMKLL
jgi:fucose 4-O-acetylase-like acetyltransferase